MTSRELFVYQELPNEWRFHAFATRLRALGGEPPLTDWIVWLWQGKPAPAWD